MIKISAFADEIGSDLDFQIQHLKANGVGWIELRGVWDKNVMALSRQEIIEIKKRAADQGIGFSAVGSPLGKFPLDGDFQVQIDGIKQALEYADILEAPYIRIFSFWMPQAEDPAIHRNQVIDWLGQMVAEVEKTSIVLAHENEKNIYGDTGERCLDLFKSLPSQSFTGIFDFANFVQCGEKPYTDCWKLLRSYITYFHVKDSIAETGEVVPAGKGNGDVELILREAFEANFDNFLTLEPHLSVAEASYGRTTPELFNSAVNALKCILSRINQTRTDK